MSKSGRPASQQYKVRIVQLSDILVHPLDIVTPTEKQVRAHADGGAVGGGGGQTVAVTADIRLGRVGDRLYLLADADVYLGALRSASSTVSCRVKTFPNENAFLVEHVIANSGLTGITNPLRITRLARAVDEESRNRISEARRGTVDEKFMQLDMAQEAEDKLALLCDYLGKRLTRFELPYYIPYHISRHDPAVQSELAENISQLIRARNVSDAHFAWPSLEEVEILTDIPAYREQKHPQMPQDVQQQPQQQSPQQQQPSSSPSPQPAAGKDSPVGDNRDCAIPENSNITISVPDGEQPSPRELERIGEILKSTRDVLVIPATDRHPAYVVDLHTRRVSVVYEQESITILKDISADEPGSDMTAHLFPPSADRWLELSAEQQKVGMKLFDDMADLAKFCTKMNMQRCVVFYR